MKRARLNHTMAASAIALALALVGCGGGGDTMVDPQPPMPPPPPDPAEVTGTLTLDSAAQMAIGDTEGLLDDNGDTATIHIAAGGTETRGGIDFTCHSKYACTVMLENNLGKIVGTWSTMADRDADGMLEMAYAMAEEMPADTFAELNDGNTASIRADVVGVADDSTTVGPVFTLTELIGMGIGGPGVLNADDAGLRSDFQANGAALTGHATDADNDASTVAIADAGASSKPQDGYHNYRG